MYPVVGNIVIINVQVFTLTPILAPLQGEANPRPPEKLGIQGFMYDVKGDLLGNYAMEISDALSVDHVYEVAFEERGQDGTGRDARFSLDECRSSRTRIGTSRQTQDTLPIRY
ncbi:hypothetical protein NLI96_g2185 [Meripilus lineatus]|uniref:Uncharacterized protein n=1 Tax=Meripilus lineatus TaxID=2056292 RepID=A0AAD5YGT4_9APHY|nr:hypothetical protein NLI96_g2185 [Physisporinus lineatus]